MKSSLWVVSSVMLVACAKADRTGYSSRGGEPANREAFAYTPTPRPGRAPEPPAHPKPTAVAPPPAPTTPPLKQDAPRSSEAPVVATETPKLPDTPPQRSQAPEVSASPDMPPAPVIFEISAAPERDTSELTTFAPLEESAPQPDRAASKPRSPEITHRPAPAEVRGNEKVLLDLINGARAQRGIAPLKFSRVQSRGTNNCMGSAGHSEYMAQRNQISHDNFPKNICLRSGASAENVAYASGDETSALRTAHRSLMNSNGHYANIMNPHYDTVGLGFFYYRGRLYVTESFLRTGQP